MENFIMSLMEIFSQPSKLRLKNSSAAMTIIRGALKALAHLRFVSPRLIGISGFYLFILIWYKYGDTSE